MRNIESRIPCAFWTVNPLSIYLYCFRFFKDFFKCYFLELFIWGGGYPLWNGSHFEIVFLRYVFSAFHFFFACSCLIHFICFQCILWFMVTCTFTPFCLYAYLIYNSKCGFHHKNITTLVCFPYRITYLIRCTDVSELNAYYIWSVNAFNT